jgi:hypothetical protein
VEYLNDNLCLDYNKPINSLINLLSPKKANTKQNTNNTNDTTVKTPEISKNLFSEDYTYYYLAGGAVFVALLVNITLHFKSNN